MVSSYTVALFFHILGVLLFVSGIVLAGAAFELARRREEAGEIALVLGLARIGAALVGPGFLIVLGFGLGSSTSAASISARAGSPARSRCSRSPSCSERRAAAGRGRPGCWPRSSPRSARPSARNCVRCSTTARRSP
jgi:hypothetical protein